MKMQLALKGWRHCNYMLSSLCHHHCANQFVTALIKWLKQFVTKQLEPKKWQQQEQNFLSAGPNWQGPCPVKRVSNAKCEMWVPAICIPTQCFSTLVGGWNISLHLGQMVWFQRHKGAKALFVINTLSTWPEFRHTSGVWTFLGKKEAHNAAPHSVNQTHG